MLGERAGLQPRPMVCQVEWAWMLAPPAALPFSSRLVGSGSQVAATGFTLFSEEVVVIYDDGSSGAAGTPDESAGPFHELTTVREFLGLSLPSSLASTLLTGV